MTGRCGGLWRGTGSHGRDQILASGLKSATVSFVEALPRGHAAQVDTFTKARHAMRKPERSWSSAKRHPRCQENAAESTAASTDLNRHTFLVSANNWANHLGRGGMGGTTASLQVRRVPPASHGAKFFFRGAPRQRNRSFSIVRSTRPPPRLSIGNPARSSPLAFGNARKAWACGPTAFAFPAAASMFVVPTQRGRQTRRDRSPNRGPRTSGGIETHGEPFAQPVCSPALSSTTSPPRMPPQRVCPSSDRAKASRAPGRPFNFDQGPEACVGEPSLSSTAEELFPVWPPAPDRRTHGTPIRGGWLRRQELLPISAMAGPTPFASPRSSTPPPGPSFPSRAIPPGVCSPRKRRGAGLPDAVWVSLGSFGRDADGAQVASLRRPGGQASNDGPAQNRTWGPSMRSFRTRRTVRSGRRAASSSSNPFFGAVSPPSR